ncbi:MAG: hypothetical protein HY096_11105 [Nitrospinae bacterium]|nr:hypothetical protein [Nitrospinota bacterium]
MEDLTNEFHNRARDIANDLYRQLLTLSTGIIAAFFYLTLDKRTDLKDIEKVLILIEITLFGLSMLCTILGMQWDASKNYFLGKINDTAERNIEDENIRLKEKYDNKQLKAKLYARVFFLLGILGAIIFLTAYLFF